MPGATKSFGTHARMGRRNGLTLVELVVVLTILVALGGLVVPMIGRLTDEARDGATHESLLRLRELLVNRYLLDMGQLPRPPLSTPSQPRLVYLYVDPHQGTPAAGWDPVIKIGWRGPYLTGGGRFPAQNESGPWGLPAALRGFDERFGLPADYAPLDAWGNPIVLQEPDENGDGNFFNDAGTRFARLVSAGPNGMIDTPLDANHLTPEQLAASPTDDLIVYLFIADEF